MSFDDITHRLTVDGDARIGAVDASEANIYLDDGVQLFKYSASGSTSMRTLHSSNGHKSPMNFAIGSSNPTVPLEINKAEGSAFFVAPPFCETTSTDLEAAPGSKMGYLLKKMIFLC